VEKVAILLNPSSGRGRSKRRRKNIERIFESYGLAFDLFISSSEKHLRELADHSIKQFKTIVAVGGDTTFNIVAGRILKALSPDRPVMGMIGTGSANDICRGLGIERVQTLCQAIKNRQVKKMDVGLVESDELKEALGFLGSMSLGLGTAVNHYLAEFSRNHRFLSGFDAIGQGLAGGLGISRAFSRNQVPMSLKLTDDTGEREVSFSLMVLLNTGYFANGLNLSPAASAFDGMLDGVVVRTESFIQTLRLQRAVRRNAHLGRKELRLNRSGWFILESGSGMDFQLDGEIFRNVRRCRVSVRPAVLDVFVPIGYNGDVSDHPPATSR
jgi:diacylglycerol kinase (ATP)